jgi:hypothetical protein
MLRLSSLIVQREIMHKFGAMLAALAAIILVAPTALAFDCDADDASECVQSILKVPPIRHVLSSIPGRPAVLKGECDADDEDDIQACLRGLKVPGGQPSKPAHPAAAVPVERKPVEKSEAAPAPAPATVATKSPHAPELAAARAEAYIASSRCQKYFPTVGQVVDIPCGE